MQFFVAKSFALVRSHFGTSKNQDCPGVLAGKVACGARAAQVLHHGTYKLNMGKWLSWAVVSHGGGECKRLFPNNEVFPSKTPKKPPTH